MASYSSNENIMLAGQSAYFKKTGTMVNHGTVERQNALTAYSLTEGYIGPNSVVHGTDLADTSDYIQCETSMRTFLGERWTEDPNERTIITNSNVISNALATGEANMQTLANKVAPYIELEYIESTGTQYIDTGYKPNNNTKIETQVIITQKASSTNYDKLYGSSDGTYIFGVQSNMPTDQKLRAIYYKNDTTGGRLDSLNDYSYNVLYTLIQDKNKYYLDGVLQATDTAHSSISFTCSTNLAICNMSSSSGTTGQPSYLKIYYFKIWDNEVLIRDFIPVKRTRNNEICLYDKVTDTYYTNQGTGTFTAGPVKS